ncbi:MAG: hypothetical protein AT718_08100 [Vulcanisaeta sp. JCHS_4]|jgi:hypothetical protein|nr:MAG: hypothetical protein AT718_08100 [Vulcanisaeta sp. JCHS_4]
MSIINEEELEGRIRELSNGVLRIRELIEKKMKEKDELRNELGKVREELSSVINQLNSKRSELARC